jgi:hypothetical protein
MVSTTGEVGEKRVVSAFITHKHTRFTKEGEDSSDFGFWIGDFGLKDFKIQNTIFLCRQGCVIVVDKLGQKSGFGASR